MAGNSDPYGRSSRRSALAFGLFAFAILAVAVAIVGSLVVNLGFSAAVGSFLVTNSVMGLAFPIAGVLIAWQRPRNPIGWLLLAEGIGHATTAAMAPVLEFGLDADWPEPALRAVATFYAYSWPWSIGLCLPVVLLLFPNGHLLSPRAGAGPSGRSCSRAPSSYWPRPASPAHSRPGRSLAGAS